MLRVILTCISRLTFIRMSLATCLLLYGCDRHYIISLDFVKKEEVDHLPSR